MNFGLARKLNYIRKLKKKNLTEEFKQNNNKKSFFQIVYGTIIKIKNEIKDKKDMEKIILCDVQVKVYPKIENIFIKLINDAGYPGIKFEKKVDFERLYKERSN